MVLVYILLGACFANTGRCNLHRAVTEMEVPYKGRKVTGVRRNIESSTERWSEAILDDGSRIRMKIVFTDVARVDGEWDSEGNPIYVIRSTNVVSVEGGESVRRKVNGGA